MNQDRVHRISVISLFLLTFLFMSVLMNALSATSKSQEVICKKVLTEYNNCGLLKHGSLACWEKFKTKYPYCPDIVGED